MRVLGAVGLCVAALVGAGWVSAAGGIPTIGCDRIIGPDAPSAAAWRPTRVVLGVAAVPPAYIPQTTASGDSAWPYWSKSGLVIRANSSPVVVSVATRWRSRAAITWGNSGAVSALRIASCPARSAIPNWNPYAGGFFLSTRAACVPLTFTVGGRSATARFGVGKRCSG